MNPNVDVVFDVDGVFNAFPPMGHRKGVSALALDWGWDCAPVEVEAYGYPITYSTLLVERVHALVERPEVTPYWLTTWREQARNFLAPAIGLDGAEWPVVPEVTDAPQRVWWKLPAIQRHVEETDHRVVWIDDDLAFDSEAQVWVKSLNETEPRILGLAPATHNGLTLAHLDLIEHWIETGEVPS